MAFEMNDEDKLYDEFGNYIGPAIDNEDNESQGSQDSEWSDFGNNANHNAVNNEDNNDENDNQNDNDIKIDNGLDMNNDNENENENENDNENDNVANLIKIGELQIENTKPINSNEHNAIILHEDKDYYKTAEEIYGDDVEAMVQEEDTQPLETPIIAPIKQKCFDLIETTMPQTSFNFKFLAGLMDMPDLIRNIALIGHLHHGKTSFIDILVKETHFKKWKLDRELRYTDTRKDEQARGLSIKCIPMSLILPDLRDKHYLINIMDCPGHVNFSDEMTAALRLADGAVIVVDAAEGVLLNTERSIRHAASQRIPMVLVVNKIDRLIIELKIPPRDAYLKLVHTISDVNSILMSCGVEPVSPVKGNVCFASSWFGFSFTLQSFSKIYSDYHKSFDSEMFAKRLWGDWYLCKDRKFRRTPENEKSKNTFVEFILEPLYKICSHVLGNDPEQLTPLLSELGLRLKKQELQLNAKPLLTLILSRFFGQSRGFVKMIIDHIPSPIQGNRTKVESNYTGDLTSNIGVGMLRCDPRTKTAMVNITKMYPRPDASAFDSFGRVFCGTIHVGDRVRVLREGYSLDDDEDMSSHVIEKIWVFEGRYRVEVNRVTAGNWALFGGIDAGITKTATITHENEESIQYACIFRPLQFNTISIMKVAIEPIKPSELPKMTHGLRCINKSYPLCITKVEESGEHVIIGTGELYLDCLLRDLRDMYSEIEIKVADPIVSFCETVEETSSMQCFAFTPNKKNKLTVICEPLDKRIAVDIETGKVSIDWEPKKISDYFVNNYKWDAMAGRNIWAFGPDFNGTNILQDDTLPTEISKSKLNTVRNSIIQGFQWGTREGPLCDEPIRNCRFKLIDAMIAENAIDRSGGQIIPTARRVLYSSFMLAQPRLMEPVLYVEATCPPDCVKAVEDVATHRRGRLIKETPKPGTPFVIVSAEIPAIDAFGFETDLRSHTQGQAFCLQVFLRWDIVPGDPMDETITLLPLEPQETNKLAREFMIKTRKRKGLAENVSGNKYFDDEFFHAFSEYNDTK